jgi:hypothetical protein
MSGTNSPCRVQSPIHELSEKVRRVKERRAPINSTIEAIETLVGDFTLEPLRLSAPNLRRLATLPPISRIRASMEEPAAPPKSPPAEAKKVEPPKADIDLAEQPPILPAPEPEAEESKKVIHIKPPIIVKQLAIQLGLQPHQLIAELMSFNIFANVNQTIEPDIASKIAENHGCSARPVERESPVLKVAETAGADYAITLSDALDILDTRIHLFLQTGRHACFSVAPVSRTLLVSGGCCSV